MPNRLVPALSTLTLLATTSVGCLLGSPPSQTAQSTPTQSAPATEAATTPTPATAKASALKSCGPDGVIDDAEDNNNATAAVAGRAGYWYTFLDDIGSTIASGGGQQQGGSFAMASGGAQNSKYSANMKGKIGKADHPPKYLYAGMGFNFLDPKGPYDAKKYKGISFWAKKAPSSTGKVRLKLPDGDTDPDSKVCTTGCFNDFGADLNLTDAWTQYSFAFSELKQLPGWGSPRPESVNPATLYSMQWQLNQPNADFDISIDQIEFLCE
jgi:endoglucanase